MVKVEYLGSCSARLTVSGGATVTAFFEAMENVILNRGWILIDTVTPSSRVYRSLNADGVSYKYVNMELSANSTYLRVYESWDVEKHTGTNLCFNSDSGSYCQQAYIDTGGIMYVCVHPRYLILYSLSPKLSFGSASGSGFSGCIEYSRDTTSEELKSYPSFAWFNSSLMLSYNSTSRKYGNFSPPRTCYSNATGQTASDISRIGTIIGVPPDLQNCLPTTVNAGTYPPTEHAFSIYAHEVYSQQATGLVRGRFYGLKLIGKGEALIPDTVLIPCDQDLFLTRSGSHVEHLVLSTTSASFAIPL